MVSVTGSSCLPGIETFVSGILASTELHQFFVWDVAAQDFRVSRLEIGRVLRNGFPFRGPCTKHQHARLPLQGVGGHHLFEACSDLIF